MVDEVGDILNEQPYQPSVGEAERVTSAIEQIHRMGISRPMLIDLIRQRTKLPLRVILPVLDSIDSVYREAKKERGKYS